MPYCWEKPNGVLLPTALDLSRAAELAMPNCWEELKGLLLLTVLDLSWVAVSNFWEKLKGVLLLTALDLSIAADELAVPNGGENPKGALEFPVPDDANDVDTTD